MIELNEMQETLLNVRNDLDYYLEREEHNIPNQKYEDLVTIYEGMGTLIDILDQYTDIE